MSELSEVFYTFLISSICGVVLVGIRLCYKSKCKEVDFCCLKIVRDTDGEEKLDENRVVNRSNSDTNL
jgi:hypothetical protein